MGQKVILNFPNELLERTDAETKRLRITRSRFIRGAVEEKLNQLEGQRLQEALREGYIANADYYRKSAREFEPLVLEVLKRGAT